MKEKRLFVIRIVLFILFVGVEYYMMLPPINLSSPTFWIFMIVVTLTYLATSLVRLFDLKQTMIHLSLPGKYSMYLPIVFIGVFALVILVNLINSPVFSASSYANRITIQEKESFIDDVEPVDFSALPLLDKVSSQKLGDRVMGQMPELVSQFIVSDLYTQINYNNQIVRVTPLEYASMIKYFTNRNSGVKGYITVNSVSGEAELVKLENGMRYMPSAMFNENLYRKIRFSYPTTIFGSANFEIDNDGTPYWIIPTLKYSGVGLKKEVTGVVILDPVTGKSKKYAAKDIPTWVDQVYPAQLIMEQTDDWGQFKNGFFNSIFGQKDVVLTTSGYNYTVMNDDVYLYTGITSAATDQSILGFILCNLRTKETNFYAVPGAEEMSAMASAKGQVQQMNYDSTFPLLINLNNKPTYLVSLKDRAGLVKMYGFIDVEDYQKVVVTDASKGIEVAAQNYLNGNESEVNPNDLKTKTITLASKEIAMIDGTTYYYFTDTEGKRYRASIKVESSRLPFIMIGEELTIQYLKETEVTEIEKLG